MKTKILFLYFTITVLLLTTISGCQLNDQLLTSRIQNNKLEDANQQHNLMLDWHGFNIYSGELIISSTAGNTVEPYYSSFMRGPHPLDTTNERATFGTGDSIDNVYAELNVLSMTHAEKLMNPFYTIEKTDYTFHILTLEQYELKPIYLAYNGPIEYDMNGLHNEYPSINIEQVIDSPYWFVPSQPGTYYYEVNVNWWNNSQVYYFAINVE